MTEQQPITPPPELVEQWCRDWTRAHGEFGVYLVNQAARWGADQQLNADGEWLHRRCLIYGAEELRAAMRPKPPSLAVKALIELESHQCAMETNGCDTDLLRAALERLQELESNG